MLYQKLQRFLGNSLVVQWWELCTFTAEGLSLIPGQSTKIPQATQQKKFLKRRKIKMTFYISISSYDGVTDTELDLLLWKTIKHIKYYFQMLGNRQHQTVILQRRETKTHEHPSFLHVPGKGNLQRTQRSHWVEKIELHVWGYWNHWNLKRIQERRELWWENILKTYREIS